jgi:hypothetical protein
MVSVITPELVILVFFLIFILALIITWRVKPDKFDDSRARVFVFVFASLGVIITFLFYYSVVLLQQEQEKTNRINQTFELNDNVFNSLLLELDESARIIPVYTLLTLPLQSTCYFENFTLQALSIDSFSPEHILRNYEKQIKTAVKQNVFDEPCTPETIVRRTILGNRIFSAWQEVILAGDIIDIEPLAYVTNFLQRANSPLLFLSWQLDKINFNEVTQKFGDLLFCYALPITDQRPEVYVETAKKLMSNKHCCCLNINLSNPPFARKKE